MGHLIHNNKFRSINPSSNEAAKASLLISIHRICAINIWSHNIKNKVYFNAMKSERFKLSVKKCEKSLYSKIKRYADVLKTKCFATTY